MPALQLVILIAPEPRHGRGYCGICIAIRRSVSVTSDTLKMGADEFALRPLTSNVSARQ